VRLRLVDVGDEGVRDEQVVDGDHDLGLILTSADDLGTGSVVLGDSAAERRELRGLTAGDGANLSAAQSDVVLFERGQDFASEDFEKERINVASTIDLTDARHSGVCHLKSLIVG
jgi:hypothetical protein